MAVLAGRTHGFVLLVPYVLGTDLLIFSIFRFRCRRRSCPSIHVSIRSRKGPAYFAEAYEALTLPSRTPHAPREGASGAVYVRVTSTRSEISTKTFSFASRGDRNMDDKDETILSVNPILPFAS